MSLLLAPWTRLSLLLVLLVAAGVCVLVYEPQRLLSQGWPTGLPVGVAVLLFAAAYGLCTAAFVPRPLLNLAAGAVFGTWFGLVAAVGGTVLGAGISFGLGRAMGQEALRPFLRGRWLKAADAQLSGHGFRSVLAVRIFPGVPFAAANYLAAVSRCGWLPFLLATALGTVPNAAAYVIAGASASSPGSPAFLVSSGFIAVSGVVAAAVAWRGRHRLAAPAVCEPSPVHPPVVGAAPHGP
ncbi:putative membrane protein YdjX (TVP38/TMEM64 family) [Streptomyces sp. 3211.6]|uniref:TVP38/TMEM64 family protein n=1 Tax=Streptomyces TaxID=1883 RepID=UPI0009A5316A|nr:MULTISPECIES: VTT domain-containing protein [Streptomyces]RKT03483.1 putative membrane protein YdjX (TVP38/TMEM64 family) [Streptomyces sp. 3211.6]RPF25179.1 putative membrane protein YdjX (TVP38/TMEM64 family) [Streptomyces sp. Ag109_G2-6]